MNSEAKRAAARVARRRELRRRLIEKVKEEGQDSIWAELLREFAYARPIDTNTGENK